MHTHANLPLTADLYAVGVLGLKESDVCYSVAKLFFAYGLGNAMTFPMAVGATTILSPDRPTPDGVAKILREHPVTVFYAVPTFYAAFLANPSAPERAQLKLRLCISAGEALPPEVGERWTERYGVDLLDGIGSTEMLHIFISNYPGDVKYGTTGKPVPGYDIRLIDDAGNVITKTGEMGEMQVRGPTSAIMYWNNRDKTRDTFLGEWTRSGDKYLEDEDGYYVSCGRRDDMLKVGGIYVSPFEVEGALASHPEVLEAAVDRLAGRRGTDQAQGLRGAQDRPTRPATHSRANCRITSRRSSRPTNIRAGSSFAAFCPRPRPARSSGSCSGRSGHGSRVFSDFPVTGMQRPIHLTAQLDSRPLPRRHVA